VSHLDVKAAATGHWKSILLALGVHPSFLTMKHGPCPECEGKDRFRFTDHNQDGMWVCSTCGAGDGFSLLAKFKGFTRTNAIAEVGKYLNVQGEESPKRDDERQALNELWRGCSTDRTPVIDYLKGRGLGIFPHCLKFHPNCMGERAMLAQVLNAQGHPVGIHRTYIDRTEKRKMYMPPTGAMSHVALFPLDAIVFASTSTLCVTEGIESAIAVYQLCGAKFAVWSCLDAGTLAKFTPPSMVKRLIICGDNDASYAGHASAYKLAHRLHSKIRVEVRFPKARGDFLDVLNTDAAQEAT